MYNRTIQKHIEKNLFKWWTIVLYWARQVGKTTLVKIIWEKTKKKWIYIDWDLLENRQMLGSQSLTTYKSLIGKNSLVIIDEAQRIENIWLVLKILHDNFPKVQIIATWSSSFDLANKINEPLTWRTKEFFLPPLSYQEIYPDLWLLTQSQREKHLLYWWYPRCVDLPWDEAKEYIKHLSANYLYKDVLEWEQLKKSPKLLTLLQLLALQIWSEVSLTEIWQKLQISFHTVQHYIDLLEKSFVIFKLHSFSKNIRNELTKSIKIYFWDIGIRNALIDSFQQTIIRQDIWVLWENMKQVLFDDQALTHYAKERKIQPFKIKQIFYEMYKNQHIDFDDMTTLSKEMRAELAQDFVPISLNATAFKEDKQTTKIWFTTHDGHLIETVIIYHRQPSQHVKNNKPKINRITLCISSQVWCPVNCLFCVTGKLGLVETFLGMKWFLRFCMPITISKKIWKKRWWNLACRKKYCLYGNGRTFAQLWWSKTCYSSYAPTR
jgi:uncharacterized protein